MIWIGIDNSELLFWFGIVLMVAAAVSAVALTVLFCITGRRLKKRLEQEYGKMER